MGCVLFIGDLVNNGEADEFKELDEWLRRLRQKLEELGSKPLFLSVPGNDDLARPKKSNSGLKLLTGLWLTDEDMRKAVWNCCDESDCVKTIKSAFNNYMEWQDNSSHGFSRPQDLKTGILPGDFAATIKKKWI